MNRSFLIILIPAILVAVYYVLIVRMIGVQLSYLRLVMAGVGFLALIGIVHFYRRRHPRRPNT